MVKKMSLKPKNQNQTNKQTNKQEKNNNNNKTTKQEKEIVSSTRTEKRNLIFISSVIFSPFYHNVKYVLCGNRSISSCQVSGFQPFQIECAES